MNDVVKLIQEIEKNPKLQNEILTHQDKKITSHFVEYPIKLLQQKVKEKQDGKLTPITAAPGRTRTQGGGNRDRAIRRRNRKAKAKAAQEAKDKARKSGVAMAAVVVAAATAGGTNKSKNGQKSKKTPPSRIRRMTKPPPRGGRRTLAQKRRNVKQPQAAQAAPKKEAMEPLPVLPPSDIKGLPVPPCTKINYIVASAPKKLTQAEVIQHGSNIPTEIFLEEHLWQLSTVNTDSITQITIVSKKPAVKNYPKSIAGKIQNVVCNKDSVYSMFLEAYKKYPGFDLYIVVYDEYFPACEFIIDKLYSLYITNFKAASNPGYLCSRYYNSSMPHAAHSPGLIHKKVFEKMQAKTPNLSKQLNLQKMFKDQINFSTKILDLGFQIKEFAGEYSTPFFKAPKKVVNRSHNPTYKETCLFAPMQMIDNHSDHLVGCLPVLKGP